MTLINNTTKDISQYIDAAISLDIQPIKINKNKTIGLIKNKPIVIKHFALKGLKRIVHKKYAQKEFVNLQKAQSLGVSVPNALFFYSDRKYFPKTVVVAMSQVQNSILLSDTIDISNPQDSVIRSIGIMLTMLYNTGANHIDLSPDNIFINNDNSTTIIDWQYANFINPGSKNQFIMQTVQLLKYLNRKDDFNLELFLLKLFQHLPEELQEKSIYNSIQHIERSHLTKKQRFNV